MVLKRYKKDGAMAIIEKSQLTKFEEMGYTLEVRPEGIEEEVVEVEVNEVAEESVETIEKPVSKTTRKSKKKEETKEENTDDVVEDAEEKVISGPDIVL